MFCRKSTVGIDPAESLKLPALLAVYKAACHVVVHEALEHRRTAQPAVPSRLLRFDFSAIERYWKWNLNRSCGREAAV
jgi:hypothetical protein